MTDLGGLTARIGLNTTGLKTGRTVAEAELLKVEGAIVRTERASARLGTSFGSVGKIAGAFLGFELLKKGAEGLKSSIEYANELEATQRRVATVFGTSAQEIRSFGKEADATLGRTQDAALATTVRFGTLGTQFGETAAQAAKSSIELTKLATDLAASKGTSVDQAEGALATGLVGRGRALRLYGVYLDAASVKQEAFKEGLIASTKDAITPAITYQASYNLIMAQTAKTQGYFAKNTDLTVEKLAIAKATLRDASEEIGVAFAPAAKSAANILANDLAPSLKVAGEGLGFIADHRLTRDLTLTVGAVSLLALATAKVSRAVTDVRELFAKTFGHAENAAAITAEGDAAVATAAKLDILAASERGSGAAAGASATARTAGGLSQAEVLALRGGGGATGLAGAASVAGPVGLAVGASVLVGLLTQRQDKASDKDILKALKDSSVRQESAATDPSVAAAIQHDYRTKATSTSGGFASFGDTTKVNDQKDALKLLQADKAPTQQTSDAIAALQARITADEARIAADAQARLQAESISGDPVTRARASASLARTAAARTGAQRTNGTALSGEASIVGGALGGAFDALPSSTNGDPAKAAQKVQTASDRVAAATSREALARQHLNTLQASGKATALQLASATASVANAQRSLAAAQSGLTGSKDAQAKAAGTAGLSATDLLGRITGQVKLDHAKVKDAQILIHNGVSKPVLEEIEKLETTVPGTLAKVASGITPKLAASLNAREHDLVKTMQNFIATPLDAAFATAERLAKRRAAALAQTIQDALNDGGTHGLGSDPTAQHAPNAPRTPAKGRPGKAGGGNTYVTIPNATINTTSTSDLAAAAAGRSRVHGLVNRTSGG